VKDAGGTILMVEEPNGQGAAGNVWPSISCAPLGIGSLVQIDPDDAPPDPSAGVGVNLGKYTYQAHDKRFNYLFHDGHVAAVRIEQTVGTGTRNAPGGMWTVAPDD
jgi:prepilin-type processing-associated H-X9-DG protein